MMSQRSKWEMVEAINLSTQKRKCFAKHKIQVRFIKNNWLSSQLHTLSFKALSLTEIVKNPEEGNFINVRWYRFMRKYAGFIE